MKPCEVLDLARVKDILAKKKNFLREKYNVKDISLFGSFVRGEQKESSDLDILVSFTEPVSLLDIAKLEVYLSELIGIKIDIVPKEDIRLELRRTISQEEVPL
jgi:predicted nucleotidyltransferase